MGAANLPPFFLVTGRTGTHGGSKFAAFLFGAFEAEGAVILGQAVLEDAAAMVQDDGLLTVPGPHNAAGLLQVQAGGAGRTGEDGTLDRRQVPAFNEQANIGDQPCLTPRQPCQRGIPLVGGGGTVQMLRRNASLPELRGNVLGMLNGDCKGDGADALRMATPVLDQVADEVLSVDGLSQGLLVVVPSLRFHRGEVGQQLLGHGKDTRFDEVALGDELAGSRHDEQVVEGVAQSLAVGAKGGGREPQVDGLRVELRNILISARFCSVALIYEEYVRKRLGPIAQGIDAGHLHGGAMPPTAVLAHHDAQLVLGHAKPWRP
jgi:hypothetical protein